MVKKTIKKNMKLKHKKRLSKNMLNLTIKKLYLRNIIKKKTNKRTRKNRNLNGGENQSILSRMQDLKEKAMTTDVTFEGLLENIKNSTLSLINKTKTETLTT